MNEYVHIIIIMSSPHHCVRTWEGPTGAGGRRIKTNTINHVHAHLVGFGGVCRVSVHYEQCYRTWGVGSTATT